MFSLFGSRKGPLCDGHTRRDFLKAGALGLGGWTLADLLRARAAAAAGGQSKRNTSVVWLWLGGGPTHIETFDPKMSAPAEFRSVVGAVKTNVPGIELGGVFPKMAQRRRQDGLRPFVRAPQLRPRRRHALGNDRLQLPAGRQRTGADQARPRLHPGPPSRRQQLRHRPADLCAPERHSRRWPGLAWLRLCSLRRRRQRARQHEPQGRARPPERPPFAAEDLRYDGSQSRPQRIDARSGQFRVAGI